MSRTKAEWRRHFLAARRDVDEPSRRAHSAAIVERVLALPAFRASRTLLTYSPLGAEVDPEGVKRDAISRGIAVYGAATAAGPVSWSRDGGGPLDDHALRRTVSGERVIVLVPGLGFDESRRRVGRGGGFYDRSLAVLREMGPVCAVGMAYEMQIVVDLPHEPWDQGMDVVVTERRLLQADATGGG